MLRCETPFFYKGTSDTEALCLSSGRDGQVSELKWKFRGDCHTRVSLSCVAFVPFVLLPAPLLVENRDG